MSTSRSWIEEAERSLSTAQKELVVDCLKSRGVIPHRFMDIDRLDPNKGTATVVEAVSQFLYRREQAGEKLEQMRAKYRFYFLQDLLHESADLRSPKTMYNKFVASRFKDLVTRYPGIVFVAEALSGANRSLIFPLLLGTHAISGGAQDGLNLAVMENCYVNRNEDTSLVIGSGAGVAIQANALGYAKTAFFPKAGSCYQFVEALDNIVYKQSQGGYLLKTMKGPLARYICRRNDSVIV